MRVVPRSSTRTPPPGGLRRRPWQGTALRIVAAVLGLAAALVCGAMAAWPAIGVVQTGVTPEYPDLHPADYRFSRERVYAGVMEVAGSVQGVAIVSSDPPSGTAMLAWPGPVRALDATVTVTVESNGEAGAIVFVTSALVRGRADFGQNARVIRALFSGLEANLALARPETP